MIHIFLSNPNFDNVSEKLISIFKKFNLLPFIIFIKKNILDVSHSFNTAKTLKSLNQSRISYRNSAFLPLKKNDDVKILLFDDLTLKTTHYAIVFNEKIKSKIEKGQDIFERGYNLRKVKIDNSFPEFILKNKEKLNEWIA